MRETLYGRQKMKAAQVLITGAGSGLGRRMALEAARRGAEVIIAAGGKTCRFTANLANRQAVADAAVQVGAIEMVINNADIVTGATLLEVTGAQI